MRLQQINESGNNQQSIDEPKVTHEDSNTPPLIDQNGKL